MLKALRTLRGLPLQLRVAAVSLSAAFPDLPVAAVRRLARRAIGSKLQTGLDYLRLRAAVTWKNSVEPAGWPERLLETGGGALVCTLHHGPFFLIPVELGKRGFSGQVVLSRNLLEKERERFQRIAGEIGQELGLLAAEDPTTLLRSLRTLRNGQSLFVVLDETFSAGRRDAGARHFLDLEFLNAPIRVRSSAWELAARAQVPVLPALFTYSGFRRRRLELAPPIPPPSELSPEAIREVARRAFAWFEERIRSHPEHWNGWFTPHMVWREAGRAPSAAPDALEQETQRVRGLLREDRAFCRADPLQATFLHSHGARVLLYEGRQRRVLRLPALAAEILRAGWRGRRLSSVLRKHPASEEELVQAAARISLSGLVEIR